VSRLAKARAFDPDHVAQGRFDLGMAQSTNGASAMSNPIPDKAEVALEFPDKFYRGTFEHSSRFDAHLDATGVSLLLERRGEADMRKSLHVHLGYELFAGILRELARTAAAMPCETAHSDALCEAAEAFYRALATRNEEAHQVTTEEQELILQLME
jgi:hypothetical protein